MAPTQRMPSRDDITDIRTKLDKMKQFARTTVDIVRQAGEKQIAAIKSSTGEVFLEQNAIYHERMNEIKDTCTATLDNQKILLQQGMEKFTTDRTTLLHSLDKKATSVNGTLRRKTMEFEQQSLEFAEEVHRIATLKVEDMEKAAIEITPDVDSALSAHFDTSSMQTTLKTQAEEVFTKFCDEKNP